MFTRIGGITVEKVKNVPIGIEQGAPSVSFAWLEDTSDHIHIVVLEMKSKRCVSNSAIGSLFDQPPIVIIGTNKDSDLLDETCNRNQTTIVSFPSYVGWDIVAVSSGKYSLSVVLRKQKCQE